MGDKETTFDYTAIPLGFYDDIAIKRSGMRSYWHNHKFDRIQDTLVNKGGSILDIGCFCGTFLSMLEEAYFPRQVGIDILKSQIDYAQQKYGTSFRKFVHIENVEAYTKQKDTSFDCVTSVEVIEHLTTEENHQLLLLAHKKMVKGGHLVITTPNYASLWPVLEVGLNLLSKVKYQEQHISKFTYWNIEKKLAVIDPKFHEKFKVVFKTTTHFASPFLATLSYKLARYVSHLFPHKNWKFPFGCLILIKLEKL